jgi:phytoene synthase
VTLDGEYRQAARATATGSKSFYFASRFFPPAIARSAHAIYWFCRYTDDIVDECRTREQGQIDLAAWEAAVSQAWNGDTHVAHPVLSVFLDTVRRHDIPKEYAFELIEGMRMDLNQTRYQTFEELKVFCYRVASTVGLMMCHVIGFERERERSAAIPRAIDLGIAMQLTNILRDIREDLGRGRIYLPTSEMHQFRCSEDDFRAGGVTEPLRELVRFEAARARSYYESGNAGISLLHPDGRFAVRLASDIYREILGIIDRPGFDVLKQRAVVPNVKKQWITARNLASPALRRSAGLFAFGKSIARA